MKNIRRCAAVLMFLVYLVILIRVPLQVVSAQTKLPKVSAHSYVVMDANSGEVILSENESKIIYPASTVKLMTAIVAIDNAKLSKKITVKKSVLNEIPKDASKIGLKAGQVYTLEQLLHLVLIVSAADAAETVAVGSCGSTKDFIEEMNQKAEELGLYNTSFDNTVGLDIGNKYTKTYSTASDIAELTRYAMSIKEIRSIVSKKTYGLEAIGTIKNTNRFYSTAPYSDEHYSIIGAKTGTTNAAGHVLVSAARDAEGHEIICAFFGKVSHNDTYKDTRKLLDYVFQSFDKGEIPLSLSFYDLRYRVSEEIILRFCTEGLIEMTNGGEFKPMEKVTQGYFVNTINKICNIDLSTTEENQNITIKDFAAILYKAYPVELSEDEMHEAEEIMDNKDSLSQKEVLELTELMNAGILPEKYTNEISDCITKEDMLLIADRLSDYIKILSEVSVEVAIN